MAKRRKKKKKKKFNYFHLFWIIPSAIIVLSLILIALIPLYMHVATPYGDKCSTWRFHNDTEMNMWYEQNYPQGYGGNRFIWQHTCPSGYVCTNKEYSSTKTLSEGHYIENPATGTCKHGIGYFM